MKKMILAFAALLSIGFAKAQTADEIVSKHLTALGGKEKIEKIQSLSMEGAVTVQGFQVAVTVTKVQNKLDRQDYVVGGLSNYDFTTDKEGWRYTPIQGMQKAEPKTAEEVKEAQPDLDIAGSLFNYAAKGSKLELIGKEDVDGTECFKLKLTQATGGEETYYLDPASYLIIRQKETKKINGQEIDISVDFSDYREVEGVKMPFSITQQFGTLVITAIKVNQPVDEKMYQH